MNRTYTLVSAMLALALGGCDMLSSVGAKQSTPLDPAAQNVHALFVGIDIYQNSEANGALVNLQGAVKDTENFKQALTDFYGMKLDEPQAGECASSNAVSTTLTDSCATRANILGALNTKVDSLAKGDTLLFYFAGHGAQYRDDEYFDQDSGYNGTILSSDARGITPRIRDIYDVEIKAIKDRAVRSGIYFVTIFDSCNSATATRDGSFGFARRAAPTTDEPPDLVEQLGGPAAQGGYWVHLAAAQDGQEAQETPTGKAGERSGVFTNALIDTLRDISMRHAAFGDIIREVRSKVEASGHKAQTPSAEGELTASLGKPQSSAALLDAVHDGAAIELNAGSLSGMTLGSRFALYANGADAKAGHAMLGEAVITKIGGQRSTLAADAPIGAWPTRLVARELARFYPPDVVKVGISLLPAAQRRAVSSTLKALSFAEESELGSTRILPVNDGSGMVEMRAADGTFLAPLGRPKDDQFAAILEQELQKIARVRQLLSLRTTARSLGNAVYFPVDTCIAPDGFNRQYCPPLGAGALRKIAGGEKFTVAAINRGRKPAFLYVLAISPRNTVTLVVPKPGELDRPIEPGQPYSRAGIFFRTPGPYQFVTIATDKPIRADALQQDGNGTRNAAGCGTPLERLLCDANIGLRDPGVTSVGNWSAHVTSVLAIENAADASGG